MIACIYGSDPYRIEHKIKELATEFGRKRDQQGLNVVRLDGATIESEHLRQEAMTVPFLGEKKMIIITGVSANRKQHQKILDFLQTTTNIDNVLLFIEQWPEQKKAPASAIFKYLTTLEYKWHYDQLKPAETEKWLAQYAKDHQLTIEPKAIRLLVTTVGTDLQRLTTELTKLHAYRNGELITAADVESLISGTTDSHIFKVIDALSAQDRALSLTLITNYLNAGNHPLTLVTMIRRQCMLLLQLKTFDGRPNTVAQQLRVHPFVAQKAGAHAQKFSGPQLKTVCDALLDIEQQLKRGYQNPPLLFARFIEHLTLKNTP